MSKNMNPAVDTYIVKLEQKWQREAVAKIRAAVHEADKEIKEEIKWGTPAFSDSGPVAWLFCAKEWVHFAFPQGALLDDSHGLWDEGKDTPSKAKRTIKLKQGQEVPIKVIIKLAKEAVSNNKAGKKIKFEAEPRKKVVLPDDMASELKSHNLGNAYWQRPYYQQKGYIGWVDDAKRDETRTKRIKTMIAELEEGTYMPPKHR